MQLSLKFLIVIVSYVCFSVQNKSAEDLKSVYILKHEWHVGIILRRTELIDHIPSLNNDFKESEFVEIGWGDKEFYMAEKETVLLALKAALWPTASVLHVAEINHHPQLIFNESNLVEIKLSTDDFRKLCFHIRQSFKLSEEGNHIKLQKGLYGKSYFYLSSEKYHLFQTCNVWAARGLKKASVSIKPYKAVTSKNVMRQLQKEYD